MVKKMCLIEISFSSKFEVWGIGGMANLLGIVRKLYEYNQRQTIYIGFSLKFQIGVSIFLVVP